jgi:DHA1 family multidrug resistance protein-like MFS transporter
MNQPSSVETPPSPPRVKWIAVTLPVALIALCGELGIAVLNNSALPVYFTKGLKIDTSILPLLMAPFFLSELLKTPLGVLADRFGRKPLMLGGALVTVFTPLIIVSMHYHRNAPTAILVLIGFALLRLLDGLGQAALWPALYAYIGDVVQEAKRGAAMSVLNACYMVALAMSFLIGGFVDDTFGPLLTHDHGVTFRGQLQGVLHRVRRQVRQAGQAIPQHLHHPLLHHPTLHGSAWGRALSAPPPETVVNPVFQPPHYFPSFYLTSILFAIAAIVIELALRGEKKRRAAAAEASGQEAGERLTWAGFMESVRSVPQFLLLAFVTFFGIGCVALLVKIFAIDEFGMSEQQFGTLFLGPALVIGAIAIPAGHLADKWGKTHAVRLGFVLAGIGMWGIPLMHHLHRGIATEKAGFIASAAVMGVGFVLAFPAWLALITSLAGEEKRGTVFGTVATAQGVGVLCGALLGATLYSRIGHIAPFVASAALVSTGAILALIFVRDRALPRLNASP